MTRRDTTRPRITLRTSSNPTIIPAPRHQTVILIDAPLSSRSPRYIDQARNLIRIIRVDDATEKEPPRAFLSVSDQKGVAYRTLDDVRSSEDFQQAVLKQAERDLLAFEHRYRQLQDICDMVRQTRQAVQKRIKKTESRAAA